MSDNPDPWRVSIVVRPFTHEQEKRIREIIREEAERAVKLALAS